MKKAALSISLLAGTMLMTGCVNLMPTYERPEAPVPDGFDIDMSSNLASVPALSWDEIILSDDLEKLIGLALAENRDLRVAAANVELARAQFGITKSGLLPSVTASGSITEAGAFDSDNQASALAFSDSVSAQIGVSAFELDFFSRVRNSNEADFQAWLATLEGQRAARISIASTVAQLWVQLAADLELLELAEETIAVQSESLGLTRELLEAGAATELDVRRASTSVETARAQAAVYRAQIIQDRNALRLVVGTDLPPDIIQAVANASEPIVVGVPEALSSEVLLNRPDVLQAERALMAANANIGVARAAYYPSVSLTGAAGYVSSDLESLFDGGGGWTFGPSISLPIFNAGRLDNQLAASEAQRDLAVAQYEQAIQTAFREFSDALAVASTFDERLAALEQLEEDTSVTLNLSEERFRVGVDDYLAVLDAQQTSYDARQQLITARRDRALNQIVLFQALGVTVD